MNKATHTETRDIRHNPLIFRVIVVFLPFVLLMFVEGILRLAGYGDNLDLFVRNPVAGYEKYMMVNPEIGKKYFRKLEYTAPANDIFLKEKPKDCFRIFVMGSSVVYGFPFERNLMFSRILHRRLEDAFPEKKIEVINTAITAVNSFTLLDFTDEILKQKPDAILVYEGHNEFYGAFGTGSNESMGRNRFFIRLHLFMMDSRLYQLMRNAITGMGKPGESKGAVHGTLMKRMAGNTGILYESEEYRITLERYRRNMEEIAAKVQERHIPLFIGEMVSNVRDQEPFCSMAGKNNPPADEVFQQAREAEKKGDFTRAPELYYKAKDLDCIRFRASEDINAIVREVTKKHNARLVPLLSVFQDSSPHRLIGRNLMTEHVHPGVDGTFLMAGAFYDDIIRSGIIGKNMESEIPSLSYCKLNWGYTPLDTLLAHHRIRLLKGFWPFVKNETGSDYRISYKPCSYLDSLAFSIVRNPALSLADLRLKLAQKFQQEGQYYPAFREYESLICMNPYLAVNYRDAAQCLLQMSDLPLALKYFRKSAVFEDSFFAGFRMGEIYLMMGDYDAAARCFEKSFRQAPDDKKVNVLAKSYIAFLYGNKPDRAKAVAAELQRVNAPEYLNVPPKRYLFGDYIPLQTREQVNQARLLTERNDSVKALDLLLSSVQLYDSHVANRMIGELYLGMKEYEKAGYYLKKVYSLFRFDPLFLQNLAMLYIAGKDYANAKKCIREIGETDPGFKGTEALNLLLSGK